MIQEACRNVVNTERLELLGTINMLEAKVSHLKEENAHLRRTSALERPMDVRAVWPVFRDTIQSVDVGLTQVLNLERTLREVRTNMHASAESMLIDDAASQ